ncbi:MAG TPA: TonB-dependent receptor [Bacteroidales bacterium]|nr:MAG: catecholate siderophore receptor CirA [Bacteroidetes bacterium ADurb.Bin041]HNV49934.1 TonB-dependent receptor [Bacteroidales bacterium]HPW42886.1 TonB-dependent receptor [Bacteroidales bacterium]
MTKLLSYICGATFIIVLSLCFVTKLGKAQESAIVAGRVIAQTTKTPIAFADVWLKPGRLNTITNSAGEFEIRGVKSGNYELWVKSVGFESFSQKVEIIENLPFYFSIELKNDVRFIEGVEITGQLTRQGPYLREVVSAKEIMRVPTRDVGEYLRETPNISGIRKGATNIDPVLRGMKAGQLNVQLDFGQKIEGGCPNRMDPASSHVDPNDLASVEILKGPYALRYGPIFGGIINLVSKKPIPNEGFKIGIKASKGWETNWNGNEEHLSVYGGNEKIYFLMGGNNRYYGNYKAGNSEEVKSSFKKYNYVAKVGVTPHKHHNFLLSYDNSHGVDIRFPALPMDERKDDTKLASLKYHYFNPSKSLQSVDLMVYRSDVLHEMDNKWRPISDTVVGVSKVNALNHGARIDFGVIKNDNTLHFGLDYENIFKDGNRTKNMILQPNLPVKVEPLWKNARIENLGVFSEYRRRQSDNMQWIIAGRLDFNSGISDPLALMDMKGNAIYFNDTVSSGFLNFSFSTGLSYIIDNHLTIDFSVGRGTRSPDMLERFIILLPVGYDNYDYLGNPQLKPESNHQADLTFRVSAGEFGEMTANGFFSYITDYISAMRIPPSVALPQTNSVYGVKRFTNINYALMYGFEFQWETPSTNNWKSNLAVAYTTGINPEAIHFIMENGEVTGSEKVINDPLPELPPFEGNWKLGYNLFNRRFIPELNIRMVAGQHRISKAYDEETTPGFVIFGINMFYRYNRQISISAGVKNLFDTFYYEHLNRRMIGTSASMYEPGRIAYFKIMIDL